MGFLHIGPRKYINQLKGESTPKYYQIITEPAKYVEVEVEKEVFVDRFTDRLVEIPTVEFQDKIIEVPVYVDKPVFVEKIVEVEKKIYIDKIVEKVVEVVKEVEVFVDKPFEVVKKIEVVVKTMPKWSVVVMGLEGLTILGLIKVIYG